MIRTVSAVAAVALGVSGIALGAKPTHPATPASTNANSNANATSTTGASSNANTNAGTKGNSASAKGQAAKVLFVLRGTFGTYVAANGSTNGSIVITVKGSNHESTALKSAGALTFAVSSSTKLAGTVTSSHDGIVKVRAAKNTSAADLQKLTASQLIDQGAPSA